MLLRTVGWVEACEDWDDRTQALEVRLDHQDVTRAINEMDLTGAAQVGDQVLLNMTATALGLGTGGYDFVMANLTRPLAAPRRPVSGFRTGPGSEHDPGRIIKSRYLPCQQAVTALEERSEHQEIWEKTLDGLPVLVGQLHSQIAPAAAGLSVAGFRRVGYVMTDGAALSLGFSRLVRELKRAGLLAVTFTCGQAWGGDAETVTLHSALLAAAHIERCDAVIVCQGPGNAGTGTPYGFSGIEQAQNLDIAGALGGQAIAIARMSSADPRQRHQGLSHHTRTALRLTRTRCLVPLPPEAEATDLPDHHMLQFVGDTRPALDRLTERGVSVTTMGRGPEQDPLFFQAAAAAGLAAVRKDEL